MPPAADINPPAPRVLDKRLLSEIKRIKLRTRRSMSADLLGQYRSAFRGTGLVFTDIREYAPGDDIKHIHWKITARSAASKAYVKSYDEDRQLNIMLAIDVSSSTDYGAGKSKHDRVIEFAALTSLLARHSQDNVGLCSFSGEVEEYFAPARTRSQFERIFSRLLAFRALRPASDLRLALAELNERLHRPSIVFVISDFYVAPFDAELRKLTSRHDVICVLVQHEMDFDLPEAGIVEFVDAESGERALIDTGSVRSRRILAERAAQHADKVRKIARQAGGDFMILKDNPIRPLMELMQARKARLR